MRRKRVPNLLENDGTKVMWGYNIPFTVCCVWEIGVSNRQQNVLPLLPSFLHTKKWEILTSVILCVVMVGVERFSIVFIYFLCVTCRRSLNSNERLPCCIIYENHRIHKLIVRRFLYLSWSESTWSSHAMQAGCANSDERIRRQKFFLLKLLYLSRQYVQYGTASCAVLIDLLINSIERARN